MSVLAESSCGARVSGQGFNRTYFLIPSKLEKCDVYPAILKAFESRFSL